MPKWSEHHSENVKERHYVTILWDFTILNDWHINANKPDMVMRLQKNLLVDITGPSNNNICLRL